MAVNFPTENFTKDLHKYQHQLDFLRLFDSRKYRYSYLVWARRHGKSTMAFNILIRECLQNPKSRYAFIFTTFASAKNIILIDPQMMSMLPEQDYDGQIWTLNKTSLTITFCNGSVLSIYGADKPDSLRGINCKGCVIDEWSQHKSDAIFTNVIDPVLTRNQGWCIFIYTPNGVNHASEVYNRILSNEMGDEWYCSKVTAEHSGLISKEELEKARQRMGDLLYRQEFLCEDLADDDLVIVPQKLVLSLETRTKVQKYLKRVIAIDPALTGDECIAYYMENSEVKRELSIVTKDTTVIAANALVFSKQCNCNNIVIDSIGIGKGPSDQLRAAGLYVIDFIASEKAEENARYLNKKAEAWFNVRHQMERMRIPPIIDVELKKQLSAVRFEYSGTNQRIKCEPKTITRQRLGRSPDRADAFVMGVFAYNLLPDDNRYKAMSNLDRDRLNKNQGQGSWASY